MTPWDEGAWDSGFWDYDAAPPLPPTIQPKRSKMPKSAYIKRPDDQFSAQLQQFKTNIGAYATLLNVTPAEVTAQTADADYFAYELACQDIALAYAQQCTAWKKLVRSGGTPPASGAPAMPTWPEPIAAVAPGIEPRFRALAQRITKQSAYNDGIGEALGIVGDEQSAPNLSTVRPVIDAAISGNHVELEWGWQGNRAFLGGVRLEVDRGDGTWRLLATDTTPGYNDTETFPATPTKWKYRAIYFVGDFEQVGEWSQTAEVMVG